MHPLAVPVIILVVIVGFALVQTADNFSFSVPQLFTLPRERQQEKPAEIQTPSSGSVQSPSPARGGQQSGGTPPPPSSSVPGQEGPPAHLDWIEIASVRQRDPYLITLRTDIPEGKTLNLTGWTIESRVGRFTVPEGVELVPAGLEGAVFEPIALRRGDTVKLSGAPNPFKTKFNFRPNACFGYLRNERAFPISVPSSCPDDRPRKEDVSHLTPACQDFVLDYDRCEEPPDYPKTSGFANDLQCRAFQENMEFKLSYEGCVRNHKTETNFLDNEWHIYVDTKEPLIRSTHDRVMLRDPSGALADDYTY